MVNITTLGRSLEQIERIKQQQLAFADLSTQLGTGKKTQKFSGLGSDDITSLRARGNIQNLTVYSDNITKAERRITSMIDNIEEFKSQARDFADTLVEFSRNGPHQKGSIVYYDDPNTPANEALEVGMDSEDPDMDFQSVIDYAGTMYDFMVDLLNKQENGRYIMAGGDTLTRPYADNGTLDTAISTLLSDWKNETITTTSLKADFQDRTTANGNTNALTDSLVGYSAQLASGTAQDIFVRADESTQVEYTALANEQGFRDVMVALSIFKNPGLPPVVDAYTDATYPSAPDVKGAPGDTVKQQQDNFYEIFNTLTNMVTDAIDSIDSTLFRLEQARAQIVDIKEAHSSDISIYESTVADVEDADFNLVAVRIQALQTTLEASFSVTASLGNLTLVNYLR